MARRIYMNTYPHSCMVCDYQWNGYVKNPAQCPRCGSRLWRTGYTRHIPGGLTIGGR